MTAADLIAQAVAAIDFGRPSAAKRGRNPRWPYVPVIAHDGTPSTPTPWTAQIKGLAYASRGEAVAAAEHHLDGLRADLARKLAEPRYRALREQYGLPREPRGGLVMTPAEQRAALRTALAIWNLLSLMARCYR